MVNSLEISLVLLLSYSCANEASNEGALKFLGLKDPSSYSLWVARMDHFVAKTNHGWKRVRSGCSTLVRCYAPFLGDGIVFQQKLFSTEGGHLPWAMSAGRQGYLKNSVLSAPGIDDRQNFADLSTLVVRHVILGVSSPSL